MSKGRILCVSSNFPRWDGDSTTPFVLHLAQDLKSLGWEVDVLAPHAPKAALRETIGGIPVRRFRYAWPERAQTVCYQGGAMVNLRRRPWEKLKLPALVAAEWLSLQSLLMSRRYDLVHSHWVLPQGFVGTLATRLTPRPHVITLHGGDVFSLTSPLMTRFKRWALRRAEGVTVNSSYTEAAVRSICPERESVSRIPMGVSDRPLTAAQGALAAELRSRYRAEGGPLLIFVGRLVDEKGCDDALRAMARLSDLPGARLLVLGEGPERPTLERLALELGQEERVTFLGWVQPEEVRSYLAAADAFVGPSRRAADGWVEAQGLTFLEAMTAGTAVIATRSGGIVDSVSDRETGLLVDERSPEQIADAVRRLAEDPALVKRLAAGGLRRVSERFSREQSAARFDSLFTECLEPLLP